MGSRYLPISEPLCPAGTQPAGSLASYSAETVAPTRRQAYWLDTVFRRVASAADPDDGLPFHATLTRVGGQGAELVDHSGSSLLAQRDAAQCRIDHCDDLIIDLIVHASRARVDQGALCQRPASGDLMVLDLGRPLALTHARHRIVSLFLPRTRISAVFTDPARLAGRLLPRRGIAALLRSQMQMTIDHAAYLTPAERITAVSAAAEMALLAIQAENAQMSDPEQFPIGLYTAATTLINREFCNADLDADAVVRNLGCARATLYRVFAARNKSIAKTIWNTRLEAACRILCSAAHQNLFIEEIAYRCGFADIVTFNRMFKRRYQATPGEVRKQASGHLVQERAKRAGARAQQ